MLLCVQFELSAPVAGAVTVTVSLTARADCCADQSSGLDVWLSVDSSWSAGTQCTANGRLSASSQGATIDVPCTPMPGTRFVTITKTQPGSGQLALADVKVLLTACSFVMSGTQTQVSSPPPPPPPPPPSQATPGACACLHAHCV